MTARKGKESQPKPRRESASKSASGESAQNGHPMDRRQHQNRRHLNLHRTQSYRFVIPCLCELLGQLVIVLVVFFSVSWSACCSRSCLDWKAKWMKGIVELISTEADRRTNKGIGQKTFLFLSIYKYSEFRRGTFISSHQFVPLPLTPVFWRNRRKFQRGDQVSISVLQHVGQRLFPAHSRQRNVESGLGAGTALPRYRVTALPVIRCVRMYNRIIDYLHEWVELIY